MANSKEIVDAEGTPNGGVRAVFYFQDNEGNAVDESVATNVEIVEFDANGRAIWRTYGELNPEG